MSESTTSPPRYGPPSRGITARDVELAADACLRLGQRPTIEKIREKIGRGSPNTINPILDAWWKRLASRLDAGPAALHRRLPESVAHVAEALWMQALEEGRRRAAQELTREARTAAHTKDDFEVRSHVLTLREGELESRLKDRDRTQAALEAQFHELTLLLRKEQSTREAQAKRIAALEDQLLARLQSPKKHARPTPRSKERPKRQLKRADKLPPHSVRKKKSQREARTSLRESPRRSLHKSKRKKSVASRPRR